MVLIKASRSRESGLARVFVLRNALSHRLTCPSTIYPTKWPAATQSGAQSGSASESDHRDGPCTAARKPSDQLLSLQINHGALVTTTRSSALGVIASPRRPSTRHCCTISTIVCLLAQMPMATCCSFSHSPASHVPGRRPVPREPSPLAHVSRRKLARPTEPMPAPILLRPSLWRDR